MKNKLQSFNFGNKGVRTINSDDVVWFAMPDVASVLGLSNPTVSVKSLDDDERAKFNLGRQGLTNFISEPGLYKLIGASRKPDAKRFNRWVTHEVLPTIRKTGSYQGSDTSLPVSPLDKLKLVMQSTVQIGDELKKTQEDVKYLKDHRFIVSGQSNYISSSVSKSVYNWYNSNETRIVWDKKDAIKLLYRDINSQIKSVSGSKTRTTIEVCKYDIVCQLIDNWQPASSTITQLINSNFKN